MRSKTMKKRFHKIIKTKYVFIEDGQVFIKRDTQESALPDSHGEVWYPINFQWMPIKVWDQNLTHQHTPLKNWG